jgi:hypothetical protein
MYQQNLLAHVPTRGYLTLALLVLVIAGEADFENPAQDSNWPEMLMLVDIGELHF